MSIKSVPSALALLLGLTVLAGCPGDTNSSGGGGGTAAGEGPEIDPFIDRILDMGSAKEFKKKQLAELTADLDSDLKTNSFRALNVIGEHGISAADAVPKIVKFLDVNVNDEQMRSQAIRTLGRIPSEGSRDALFGVLLEPDRIRAELAADALGAHGDSVIPQVTPLLNHENASVRVLAVRVINGVIHKKGETADLGDSVVPLAKLLEDPDADVADWAIRVVLELGDRVAPAVGHLEARLAAEPNPGARAQIALVIGLVGPAAAEAAQTIRDSGEEGNWQLEAVIGVSLVRLGFTEEGLERLSGTLKNGSDAEKVLAAGYSRQLGSTAKPLINQLQDMLSESSDGVRNMVEMALRKIREEDV